MPMKKIEPEVWKADLEEFREKTRQFYAGELEAMPREAVRPVCCVCVCREDA